MAGSTPGIGFTPELSLRVSVATLTRVIFQRLDDGAPMLALENKATLIAGGNGRHVSVSAQPFGGAVRIRNLDRFSDHVGRFNFDSARSRSEQDFRVFIRPISWEVLRAYCLQNLSMDDGDFESDPVRELVEEFSDTLGIQLQPNQYKLKSIRFLVENEPTPSDNFHAAGHPTVRVYRIDEACIHDKTLSELMMANSEGHTASILKQMALDDSQKGGRGRANAILMAPFEELREHYLGIPPKMRGEKMKFKEAHMAGNVTAILEDIFIPKYRQLS